VSSPVVYLRWARGITTRPSGGRFVRLTGTAPDGDQFAHLFGHVRILGARFDQSGAALGRCGPGPKHAYWTPGDGCPWCRGTSPAADRGCMPRRPAMPLSGALPRLRGGRSSLVGPRTALRAGCGHRVRKRKPVPVSADPQARVSLLARLFETSEEFLIGDRLIAGLGDDA
jgi:hypothetical protein